MLSWWSKKSKKTEAPAPVADELPPEIDVVELTRKLDQELKLRVKIAETPCDVEHGWKLESVVRGTKVYTSCATKTREGAGKIEGTKDLDFESKGNINDASEGPAKGNIPAAVAACTYAPKSSITEGTADSLKATAESKEVDAIPQMSCCKTVGSIDGISAAEGAAMWWADWDDSQNGVPALNLQYFSKRFRVRHQVSKSPGWGIADRCSTYGNRIVHFDPEGDRYIAQSFSIEHRKRPESQSKLLKQVVATIDISCMFQTEFLNGKNKDSPDLTRKDVRCVLIYQSDVDPGGYIPQWLVRMFTKRAYPKFIENFINYCHKCYDNTRLLLINVPTPVHGRTSTAAKCEAYYQSELKRIAEEDAAESSAVAKT